MLPLLVKYVLNENPLYENAKIVISLYNDAFPGTLNDKFYEKLLVENIPDKALQWIKEKPDYINLMKTAIDVSDAIMIGNQEILPEIYDYARKSNKPLLECVDHQQNIAAIKSFYDQF